MHGMLPAACAISLAAAAATKKFWCPHAGWLSLDTALLADASGSDYFIVDCGCSKHCVAHASDLDVVTDDAPHQSIIDCRFKATHARYCHRHDALRCDRLPSGQQLRRPWATS